MEVEIKSKWVEVAKEKEVNPILKEELETEMQKTFDEADADKDGLLNIDEYKNFMNLEYQNRMKRYGGSFQHDDAM